MSLPEQQRVLIAEDDRKTSALLAVHLEHAGFSTVAAYCGQQALNVASSTPAVFAVFDVMLPDFDGWELCRRLRAISSVPILMLSGLAEAHQRVHGLTLGADDHMQKPFSFAEVIARIKAILRRIQPSQLATEMGISLDSDKRLVRIDGRPVVLTRSEFRLLEALMTRPGHVFGRDELLQSLYPNGGVVVDRVIDVHIGQLRQKIETVPSRPRFVLTERGSGYRFADAGNRGRVLFRSNCTGCHNVDQSKPVPAFTAAMKSIFPGDNPLVLLAQRDAPLNPILDTPGVTFDDKVAVVNASLRGSIRGAALPLLLDLARKPNFLHDNSVPSLEALLDPSRGATAPHPLYLSGTDRSDMAEFLRQLDTTR